MIRADELQEWLVSHEGLAREFHKLRTWSALHSFGQGVLEPSSEELRAYDPDWRKLLLAGSFLAESSRGGDLEVALMIAQSATVFGNRPIVRDAGAVVLAQLSNRRAIELAESREIIAPTLESRLGISELMLMTRRALESSISLGEGNAIQGNDFQKEFWDKLEASHWTSATAPTAAGKTYLILNWLLHETSVGQCRLGVFLAPTRALVGELEKELLRLKKRFSIPGLRIASLPIRELAGC